MDRISKNSFLNGPIIQDAIIFIGSIWTTRKYCITWINGPKTMGIILTSALHVLCFDLVNRAAKTNTTDCTLKKKLIIDLTSFVCGLFCSIFLAIAFGKKIDAILSKKAVKEVIFKTAFVSLIIKTLMSVATTFWPDLSQRIFEDDVGIKPHRHTSSPHAEPPQSPAHSPSSPHAESPQSPIRSPSPDHTLSAQKGDLPTPASAKTSKAKMPGDQVVDLNLSYRPSPQYPDTTHDSSLSESGFVPVYSDNK
jgi:hypothetical protein